MSSNAIAMGLGTNPAFPKGQPAEPYYDELGEDSAFHYWRLELSNAYNNRRAGSYAAKYGVKLVMLFTERQSPEQIVQAVKECNEGAREQVVEFVEAPNEPFVGSHTPERVGAIQDMVARAREALRSDPATANVKMIGPVVSPSTNPDLEPEPGFPDVCDFGGVHVGLASREPVAFKIHPAVRYIRRAYEGHPIAATEFSVSTGEGMSEEAQAAYVPRLWMETINWMKGFPPPYLCLNYMHQNKPWAGTAWEAEFGIRRADSSKRPAWYSLVALHDALKGGHSRNHEQVPFEITGPSDIKHILVDRGDRLMLVLWRSAPYDSRPESVTLRVPSHSVAAAHELQTRSDGDEGDWRNLEVSSDQGASTFDLGGKIVIVELGS
ncbi:MAG: hypothetical protein JSS72_03185 [Armatimonadetes bacterium]|nr:hypothetical protein [Armatimonadota bacterium]